MFVKFKESTCQCRRRRRCWFDPWVCKIPWRRKWQPTQVFLETHGQPGKTHGQKSLADYSPWGRKESETTEATVSARKADERCSDSFRWTAKGLSPTYTCPLSLPSRRPRDTEQRPLCCTAGSGWLSILNREISQDIPHMRNLKRTQ